MDQRDSSDEFRERRDSMRACGHPRYYNIAWMTPLAEVQPDLVPFDSVT
jgi:hypothetical protein